MDNTLAALSKAADQARGLAIDAIAACSSGHLGLPLGAAEVGAALFGQTLNYDPKDPKWINRDRFVLSAGHGSMFLYAWLHLSGFDLPIEEVRNFRQLKSKTPGHPEFGETPGVECTTGPLGQGVGNAVGMAISAKMAAATFNTPVHNLFDHKVVCLAGDGCLQEGVSFESIALAGHLGLDNLILIYDSNDVTLDAMASVTQSGDVQKRFEAMGWDTQKINGNSISEVIAAYEKARSSTSGRPQLIEAKTLIGKGIPEVAGTSKGHGEGGAKFADSARKGLGLPDEKFFVSEEVKSYFADHQKKLAAKHEAWQSVYAAWKMANPEKAQILEDGFAGNYPDAEALLSYIPAFSPDKPLATRVSGGKALIALAQKLPLVISGSADLHGSTKNYLDGMGNYSKETPNGRNLLFGIREHAMGAILNGFAYYGLFRASGATFATFADYMRPSVRLAALCHLPVAYIWTHDSVGVGEDGPTHQPVEITAALRCIPNLDVIRPGDAEETAGAFASAIARNDGPTALILSRQDLRALEEIPMATRREGVLRGAYVAIKEKGDLKLIIMATGSELQHAVDAAKELGDGVRVVSMPCFERFDRQSDEYRESVLPSSCRKRLSIEAGVSGPWYKYVGLDGRVIGINRFGISAPASKVMTILGMTSHKVVTQAREMLES